ncbi:exostosin family protein [Gloeocapsopsis dulcis]|uniref:RXYLT1 C-terminal domain-containing protein n=1 Tax=Gloeocapsopsis dulcis AAB1 = 1H9 TaxID=1433147 RepID=A0A6N8FS93_9CHRO|nr:exostosin family protein [Gloeocapsopsis dulcis]MUL35998.1 hypothetical protein [Gloeocapsopsis dulcis AAB1 = 1H9]WNN88251.1 exostosin family protein [Gloeocapsopsis dulcis]
MSKVVSLGKIGLDAPLDKIQLIRLYGAILESDFDVYFPPEAEEVLQHLSKYFNVKYHLGIQGIPLLKDDVTISHAKPQCRIGLLTKPLIFPHEMVIKCRAKWNKERKIRFLFCGLLTEQRKRCLDSWTREKFGYKNIFLSNQQPLQSLLQRFYKQTVDYYNRRRIYQNVGFYIFLSTRGREFPIKVWDEDYYNLLSNSQFVLCPDGDYTWTYRFFESILCGAIPIVENPCSIYDGFEYFSVKDSLNNLIYSKEIVEHNFFRAREILTVPHENLNSYLLEILRCKQSHKAEVDELEETVA